MRNRVLIAIAAGLFGLALLAFSAVVAPDANPWKGPTRPLAGSRLFTLLPDGRVEITDPWSRRVYRWDGLRWVELEVTRLVSPPAAMR
jgi:hypothetical protein